MKSLSDKNKGDLYIYTLSHRHILYIHLQVCSSLLFIYFSHNFESYMDNFVHLEFHLLLFISTSAMSGYQNKGSDNVCTNKHPGQR